MPIGLRFLLFLTAISGLFAQGTGTIVGAVRDSTGSMVPGALVALTNAGTGVVQNANSDEQGRYQFQRVPVGNYLLTVEHAGFRKFASENFKLDVDTTRRADVALQLGEVSETVTVSGSVQRVDTEGSTLKETVDVKRVEELPLNGRNPLQLQLLVAGTTTGPGVPNLSENGGISVNGARGISNNYMLDGGDNNDPLSNSAAVTPNPDAVAEFTIMTNNYDAEYGRNTGAVINVATKAGTNQFHGSLFEFHRNNVFDARNFFATQQGKLIRNQFGGSVGGPVIKNKTFFFFADQALRERKGSTFSGLTVPTAAERTGDFSQSTRKPRDPVTNQPFPGDRIPADRLSTASQNFIKTFIPLPNSSNSRHIFNRLENTDGNQLVGRVDHTFSEKHRLFGRAFRDSSLNEGERIAEVPNLYSQVNFKTLNTTVNYTFIPTGRFLNSFQFTYGNSLVDRGPVPFGSGQGISYADLGVKVERGAPADQVKEFNLVPHFRGAVTGFWNLNQDNLVKIDRKTYQYKDDVSLIFGAHTVKFGGEYRGTENNRVTANGVDAQFTFNGQFTNNALADFLIGRASRMTQNSLRVNVLRGQAFSFYLQDKWQVTQKLTVSLGVRYEPFIPFNDLNFEPSQISVFRPGVQSTLFPTAPPGLVFGGDLNGKIPLGGTPSDWNNLAPRVSLAWRPLAKTSVRAGYGVFFETPRFFTLSNFVNSPPFALGTQLNDVSFGDPYAGKSNPFPFAGANNLSREQLQNFQFPRPLGFGLSIQDNFVSGYNQQWNFNLQREVGAYLFTAAYVGSKANKLPAGQELNPALYRSGATVANIDSRRIYPDFQSISSYNNIGFSSYNALQLSLNKQFGKGYTLLAHYTFARTIDNSSQDSTVPSQNPLDPTSSKGLADFHIKHRFVTSFLWEMPSPVQSGFGKWVLGGWQANGIFTMQSGSPFDLVTGRDIVLCGCGTQRPNLIGNPFLPSGRSREEQINSFYNPTAFQLPTTGNYGNVGRNTMTGPSFWNLDFALFKNIRVREAFTLSIRAESFNALNHANLNNPVSNVTATNAGRILGASDARIIQLGLRLVF